MIINIVSYNARGLRVGHSEADKSRCFVMDKLLETCDVLCVQETFLPKQELERLNSLHKDFCRVVESTTDLSTRVVHGRISHGVAMLWHKKYDQMVNVVRLDVDWAIGIEFKCGDKKFIILNIHPMNVHKMKMNTLIDWLVSCLLFSFFIVGDMNADVSDSSSLFANHLMQFCSDSGLILSSKVFLPDNSFT